MPNEEYVSIPLSKAKLFSLLIGSVLFVGLCVSLFLNPDGTRYDPTFVKGVSFVGFMFFGLCGVVALAKLSDSAPGLVLDRNGLIDNSSGVAAGRIAWSDVRDVSVKSIRNQRFVVLELRNPERYLNKGNFLKQYFVRANYRLTGSPITISSGTLNVEFDDLCNLIRSFWSRNRGSGAIDKFSPRTFARPLPANARPHKP